MIVIGEKPVENRLLLYVLIVLFCTNFLGRGSIFCLILSVLTLFAFGLRFHIDITTAVVMVFSFAVAVASTVFYSVSDVFRAPNYLIMYMLGYNGYRCARDQGLFVRRTMFSICFGFSLYIFLTYFYNIGRQRVKLRTLYNIWTHELVAVTLIALVSSVVIGYSFYALFCSRNIRLKLFSAATVILTLHLNVSTATRTPIILLAIVYFVMFFVYGQSKHSAALCKALVVAGVTAAFAVAAFRTDFLGLRRLMMDNPLFQRFWLEGFATKRWQTDLRYLAYMPQYLWGGSHIYALLQKMAHNFLQECYDMYGIVAFSAIFVVFLGYVRNFVRLLRRQEKQDVDFLFLSVYLAIGIQLFLEPVFRGYPALMFSMLLIHGMATAYLSPLPDKEGGTA